MMNCSREASRSRTWTPEFASTLPDSLRNPSTQSMMRIHFLAAAALVIPVRGADGQSPAVRQLPPAQAESRPGVVASIAALRATASGHVFVNDIVRRQVVMLDSS